MDPIRFDSLIKTLSTTGTRRALFRLLTAVPVAGGLLALGDPEALAGKHGKDGKHGRGANGGKGGKGKSGKSRKGKSRSSTSTSQGCLPTTCAAQGKNCGSIPDGCGGTLTCGTCPQAGQPCENNVCGTCVPSCPGNVCNVSDGCGGTCSCTAPQFCGGGQCVQTGNPFHCVCGDGTIADFCDPRACDLHVCDLTCEGKGGFTGGGCNSNPCIVSNLASSASPA